MRKLALGLLSVSALIAAPPYQASFLNSRDANAKQWEAQRGIATPDSQVQREGHASLRVEPNGVSDAYVHSTPVTLTVGKSYELSGWLRTDKLDVRDTDRSPIATGASIGMASMPFDVHTEVVRWDQSLDAGQSTFPRRRARGSSSTECCGRQCVHGQSVVRGNFH